MSSSQSFRRPRPARPPGPVAVGGPLRLEDLEAVASGGREVVFGPAARARVASSRAAIDAIALQGDDAPRVYGVNTGFGALSETRISAADIRAAPEEPRALALHRRRARPRRRRRSAG